MSRRPWQALVLLGALALPAVVAAGPGTLPGPSGPIPPLFPDPALFDAAIRAQAGRAPLPGRGPAPLVTGLIVPHHLLAIDLIARGFALASARRPRRIVLLCPDHYRRSRTRIAVCLRDFESCRGRVPADVAAAQQVLGDPRAGPSSLFSQDHAVQALLPFLAHHFPGVPVLAIAIRAEARTPEWSWLADRLAPLVDRDTLVVQSTDFSHYLTAEDARRHDQQSLAVLAAGDPSLVSALDQPAHVDGRGAFHANLSLQRRLGARPLVVESRNSSEYTTEDVARTTSYMVVLFSPDRLDLPHADRVVFAGDTMTGRRLITRLTRAAARARELVPVCPVILNLEGVLHEGPPPVGRLTLAMPVDATLGLLRALDVAAVSMANNHTSDLGPGAREGTRQLLERAGIPAVMNGTSRDLGRFVLSALTDCDNHRAPGTRLLTTGDLEALPSLQNKKPWFVFLHWGQEWATSPGPREVDIARRLIARGADLIIGCHSHRPGDLVLVDGRPVLYSLGNFLFDQTDRRAGGILLEVRFFPQGTFAMRTIPVGNLYLTR